nr:hypothetical protein [Mycobacterium canetti]
MLVLHGLSEGVSGSGGSGGRWGAGEVLEGASIGVIADGVLGFPTKADCRRIRGVPVFDGYTRMLARLMGSLAVLRSVSIPKGYRDFGFGSLRAVAPKSCPGREWLRRPNFGLGFLAAGSH